MLFKQFGHLSSLLALALGVAASPAFAATDAPARCYTFTTTNTPVREARATPRTERWCYQTLASRGGALYIYNADKGAVRPELALLKLPNGTLTHGSLQAGKLTTHSVKYEQFNPFPVPLDEPTQVRALAAPADPAFENSAKQVLSLLLLAESPNPVRLTTSVGVMAAQASALPWRGYWWPMKGQPMVGPMSKYDAFVASRDRNPGAAAWESSHHVSHGVWWEGHCNGWAAAAVIRAEPQAPVSTNGVTFSVSDQKGILTEEDYCANAAFFGHRYRGRGDVLITPDQFHHALTYYLGSLHKLVAFNEDNNGVVDNRVISAYNMSVQQSGPGVLTVTMTLRVHNYDGQRVEFPGVAPSYRSVYRYTLIQGANGSIAAGGTWLSKSPGFVWVPLSPGKCSDGNPALTEANIGGITR